MNTKLNRLLQGVVMVFLLVPTARANTIFSFAGPNPGIQVDDPVNRGVINFIFGPVTIEVTAFANQDLSFDPLSSTLHGNSTNDPFWGVFVDNNMGALNCGTSTAGTCNGLGATDGKTGDGPLQGNGVGPGSKSDSVVFTFMTGVVPSSNTFTVDLVGYNPGVCVGSCAGGNDGHADQVDVFVRYVGVSGDTLYSNVAATYNAITGSTVNFSAFAIPNTQIAAFAIRTTDGSFMLGRAAGDFAYEAPEPTSFTVVGLAGIGALVLLGRLGRVKWGRGRIMTNWLLPLLTEHRHRRGL